MGRIQSSVGLTTGVDIQKTIDQLLAISSQPKSRLESRVKGYQAESAAYAELTALVLGVQANTNRLGNKSNLSSLTATSSIADVLKVTTSGTPVEGTYTVQTIQTAQTSTAASNAFTSVDDTVQAGEFVVRTGGFVDSSTPLSELRGGTGIARGKILITDRSGASREIDLSTAVTIDDVVKQINSTSGIKVSAKTSGDQIVLTDTSGGNTSNLIVAEVGEGRTAAELGLSGINVASNTATGEDLAFLGTSTRLSTLLDGRGLAFTSGNDISITLKDGTTLDIDLNASKNPTTLGQLLSTINAKDATKLEAKLTADGNGIEFIDKTTGTGTFGVSGKVASQIGVTGLAESGGKITSVRLQSTLQGPLLSTLNGGRGIGTPSSIEIRNRAGTTTSVNLSGAVSLRDVIDKINAAGAGVTASLNKNRTGIALQDTTGSTSADLKVSNNDANNSATKLRLEVDGAVSSYQGGDLGAQFVSEATLLSRLNQGRGIRLGSFKITDSTGQQTTINLPSSTTKTVGDVLKAINDTSIGVEAKLNETGDGFVLIDTAGGGSNLIVEDSGTGNAALDLGIRGTSKTVTVESAERKQIESSQTFRLSLTSTDKLSDVVKKINDANGPLTASVLTSGPSTVRLLFSSRASGEIGRIVADGDAVGVNINTTATARDAVIAVGSALDAGGILVQSSSNTFNQAIEGLSLTVVGSATTPVQVSVSKSSSTLEKNIQSFVDQYNKVVDKLKKDASYDEASKSTGVLFGSGEVLRIQQTLSKLVNDRKFGTGSITSLAELGLGFENDGRLSFDKSKLSKRMATNQADVEAFFTQEKTGFSARASQALDSLVAERTGALIIRSQTLNRRVDDAQRRISSYDLRLTAERTRLEKQFYAMEEAIAKIRNNTSAVSGIQNLFATTN
jgi:flagellar hook-associated protein 2